MRIDSAQDLDLACPGLVQRGPGSSREHPRPTTFSDSDVLPLVGRFQSFGVVRISVDVNQRMLTVSRFHIGSCQRLNADRLRGSLAWRSVASVSRLRTSKLRLYLPS